MTTLPPSRSIHHPQTCKPRNRILVTTLLGVVAAIQPLGVRSLEAPPMRPVVRRLRMRLERNPVLELKQGPHSISSVPSQSDVESIHNLVFRNSGSSGTHHRSSVFSTHQNALSRSSTHPTGFSHGITLIDFPIAVVVHLIPHFLRDRSERDTAGRSVSLHSQRPSLVHPETIQGSVAVKFSSVSPSQSLSSSSLLLTGRQSCFHQAGGQRSVALDRTCSAAFPDPSLTEFSNAKSLVHPRHNRCPAHRKSPERSSLRFPRNTSTVYPLPAHN